MRRLLSLHCSIPSPHHYPFSHLSLGNAPSHSYLFESIYSASLNRYKSFSWTPGPFSNCNKADDEELFSTPSLQASPWKSHYSLGAVITLITSALALLTVAAAEEAQDFSRLDYPDVGDDDVEYPIEEAQVLAMLSQAGQYASQNRGRGKGMGKSVVEEGHSNDLDEARSFRDSCIAAAAERSAALVTKLKEDRGVPGVASCIVLDGRVVWQSAQGLADVENNVPMSVHTAIRVASISKAFTGTALALLVQEGQIDLDAPVISFVPQFTVPGASVRHLAAHQSGIRHFKDDAEKKLAKRFKTPEDSLAWFLSDPTQHDPGAKFTYSSFGYAVLGAVIANVTKMPYHEFMTKRVFNAIGMRQTLPETNEEIIPMRSRYYSRWTGTLKNSPYVDNGWKLAGDGWLSSAHDLALFAEALFSHRILHADTLRSLLWSPQPLQNGSKTSYGLGWKVFEPESTGDWMVGHGGDAVGASSFFLILPENKVAVSIVCNLSKVDLLPTAVTLARVWSQCSSNSGYRDKESSL